MSVKPRPETTWWGLLLVRSAKLGGTPDKWAAICAPGLGNLDFRTLLYRHFDGLSDARCGGRSFGFITSRSTTPCLRNPSRLAAPSLRSKSLPQTYGPRSRTTTSRMLCGCAGFIKRRWVPKGRVLEAAVISFGLNGLPSARVEPLSFPYQLVVKTCGVGIGMLSEDDTIPPIL